MRSYLAISLLALGSLAVLAALASPGQTSPAAASPAPKGLIFTKGKQAPPTNFTGTVWVQGLVGKEDQYSCGAGSVQFAPGAHTNWHTHPTGQILLVVDGTGRYQEKGQPMRVLHKGDVVKAAPGVEHWHGAAPTMAMTHVAINPDINGKAAVWGRAVTGAEYNGR